MVYGAGPDSHGVVEVGDPARGLARGWTSETRVVGVAQDPLQPRQSTSRGQCLVREVTCGVRGQGSASPPKPLVSRTRNHRQDKNQNHEQELEPGPGPEAAGQDEDQESEPGPGADMLLQGADQRAGMKTPDWTRTQRDPPRHQEPQVQTSRGPGTGLEVLWFL